MKENIQIKILDKRMDTSLLLPSYATKGSSGLDLRACINDVVNLLPNKTVLIPTGIAMHIKNPYITAMILPRSGLGHNHGIILGNLVGVIDSDYQGQIMVSLWNRSNKVFSINLGMRIAQIIFIPIIRPMFTVVNKFSSSSNREDKGFGHSGTK